MQLRDYQQQNLNAINNSWYLFKNVLSVLPTGAGKTVIFSEAIKQHNAASCAIAHRQELVSQISLALARDEVPHKIIGPKEVVKLAVGLHMEDMGRNFYDPSAQCAVAGVDTLIRRVNDSALSRWFPSVSLWVMDEAHHVLRSNKWGKAVDMFPNAKGLGVTATPERADGKGLGKHADGVFEDMIVGPSGRDLINMGYLTDYRIFAPRTEDLNLTDDMISVSTGDYVPAKIKKAVRKSRVVGDVVKHYLRIAPGKRGITFSTDVETATDQAAEFNRAGVPAAVVSAKTPDAERVSILRRFKNGELLQLVNVDLFGEGFDLPAIEVVSMARPTASFALYAQQFGRALRLLEGKTEAIIIDHVGNVVRHGLPDAPRQWTLDAREKRSRGTPDDVIPLKSCMECFGVYERIKKVCPYCGHVHVPDSRNGPEFVDGDLAELDAATLAKMRGDIERMDMDPEQYRAELQSKYVPKLGQLGHVKRHIANQEMQKALRSSIALWAGYHRRDGHTDDEIQRIFYFKFGVDVMTAQALKRADALTLANRVNREIGKCAS